MVDVPFGPESHQFHAYPGETGDQFAAEAFVAFEAARQRQKALSIELPQVLMKRARAESKRRRVPYQTLIKIVLEKSLDGLGAA